MNFKLNILSQIKKYLPLIRELVLRDLKVKYKHSLLGYLWSLINPLAMMAIMSLVFSYMFRFDVPNYPLYVIIGQTLWTFFFESTNMAMSSVINNGSLIKKVYIPKFIFPISRVFSSFVTMSFSLLAIIIVMVFTNVTFGIHLISLIIPMSSLLLFCMGIGLMLSALSVYFRDTMHLYGVVTTAWMYCTPIFWTFNILPEKIQYILSFNPLYQYIDCFRLIVLNCSFPNLQQVFLCFLYSILALCVGLFVFYKMEKKMILYI